MKLAHAGINVMDLDGMIAFYEKAFGLVVSDIAPGHIAFLTSEIDDHHQIVLASGRPYGLESADLINQISFQLDDLKDLRDAYFRVVEAGAHDINPVTHGNAWALYFRDPEGNRLEMFVETPWYIQQPHLTVIDMTKSVKQIYAETEALCRADPSFATVEEWREKMGNSLTAQAH